jgi:transcriptional regulator with XRE-family HTH domain
VSSKFQDLLLEKYLEWQRLVGERKNLKQFAEHIGIGEKYLNLLWNAKREPSLNVIETLVLFFKDPRFYDAVGLPRPDPVLSYAERHWKEIPKEVGKRIADEIGKYTTEKPPEDNNGDL